MRWDEIRSVLEALARENVEYVLVGGVAIGLHGFERPTRDIDLFVRPDAENIGRLRKALQGVYSDPEIDQITVEDLLGEYPTIRYGPPGSDFVIDILARLGDAIQYDDLEFERTPIDGVEIRLATPRTLYRMKRATLRDIDRIDAANLRDRFDVE